MVSLVFQMFAMGRASHLFFGGEEGGGLVKEKQNHAQEKEKKSVHKEAWENVYASLTYFGDLYNGNVRKEILISLILFEWKVLHMKLLVNKRSLIFPVTTPTVDLGQNIRKTWGFSFRYLFVWRFMTSYLQNSKITPLTHILSFVLLSISEKNPRTLAITFGKLSVF